LKDRPIFHRVRSRRKEKGEDSLGPRQFGHLPERLRTGSIFSIPRARKWQPRHSVQCSCAGAPVQDSEHLLLECPSTQHHRQAILDSLGVRASQNSELKAFIEGYPMRSVLLSTMGAPPPGPWDAFDGHTHRAVMDLAAPMWAREFADHL
jgi:hypothetical protein